MGKQNKPKINPLAGAVSVEVHVPVRSNDQMGLEYGRYFTRDQAEEVVACVKLLPQPDWVKGHKIRWDIRQDSVVIGKDDIGKLPPSAKILQRH